MLSHPRLAPYTLDYFARNKAFLAASEVERTPDFYTLKGQRVMLRRERRSAKGLYELRYWLLPLRRDKVIGTVMLNGIMRMPLNSAFLGYRLDQDETGKGYAREAVRRLLKIAFDDLELHRLEANILTDNQPSLRLAEELGFVREGVSRQYLYLDGQWRDHQRLALLAHDYAVQDVQLGRKAAFL